MTRSQFRFALFARVVHVEVVEVDVLFHRKLLVKWF